jgi:hypothetical protein
MATDTAQASADFSAVFKELEKLVKQWETVAKAQEKTNKSADKTLTKFAETAKTVSDLAKSLGTVVKNFDSIISAQQRLSSQTDSTTSSIQRQRRAIVDLASTNARYAGDLVQRGTTQAGIGQLGATRGEQVDYKNAAGRLREIVAQHNVAREHITKIWGELGRGETQAYAGALRKVRNALEDVLIAKERLGAESRKQLAKAKAEAEVAEKQRLRALEEAKAAAQEEAALKRRQQLSRKADSATSLLLQKGISRTEIAKRQATPEEILSYKNAITSVRELRAQHDIAYSQISKMWDDIGKNRIRSYVGGLSDIQTAMLRVKNTQAQLGASFTKQIDAQAAAFFKVAVQQGQATQSTKKLKGALDEVTLSWKSFTRLIGVQLIHQAVSSIIRTIREGMGTVIELGIRIGEVQTISSKFPLGVNQWVDGFRKLSDTWGGPLLDQVAAGYEAISDQIVEGADTFRYLQEVNQFAVTSVSTTTEAVQLLDATINAFKLDTSRANEIAASFFATIDLGRVKASEMAQTFGQLAVPAAQVGVKLNELQSLITVASRQGIKYNTTATYLRNVFLKLIKPTEEMSKWFKELGVETGQAAIETYGFLPFLTLLSDRFGEDTAEIGKLMGRLRAMQGVMSITGKSLKEVEQDYVDITEAVKTYNDQIKLITEKPEKQLAVVMERIKNFFTVDVGKRMIDTVAGLGANFDNITAGVKAFSDTIFYTAVPAVGALTFALAGLNPILAGLAALGTGVFISRFIIRLGQEKADKIDRATADNQKKWLDRELLNINTAYDARVKAVEDASKKQLQSLAEERGLLTQMINLQKEPYEDFLGSVTRFEEKIIDSIRDRLSTVREEINRLEDIAKKKQKDFNKEMEATNYIMERRLSGKDRYDRKEPDLFSKYQATAAQVGLLEEELAKAAKATNKERFEAISAELKKLVKEQIDFSDQLIDAKKWSPIKSGEGYYRYYLEEIARYDRMMQGVAASRLTTEKQRQQYLEDELSIIKDLSNIVTKASWTDLTKITSPEELQKVTEAQSTAFKKMEEYSKKYGTQFYKDAQIAFEKLQIESLVNLRLKDASLAAQQQVLIDVRNRQIEEIEGNRQIWLRYVESARTAIGEVRGILSNLITSPSITMDSKGNPRYASGRSAGIDTQLAWLSPDEMVMNPAASRKFYSQLVAMNSGVRRFNSGSTTYNFGDMNFNGVSSSPEVNVLRLGKSIKKQIRLGRLSFAN